MKVLAKSGNPDIATVYIAEINGNKIEFVESIQPPIPREKKWVLILSSLYGCPVQCKFCDAGGFYSGKLSVNSLLEQIDYLVKTRFPDGKVNTEKFKIQFARMGEPTFNENVIEVLKQLPRLYKTNLFPSISTVAPAGVENFFEKLLKVKQELYKEQFQLQFSIHTTNLEERDNLIPINKWSFEQIKEYGNRFYQEGDRKITLNFAINTHTEVCPDILRQHFSPDRFLVKITPINPTISAIKGNLNSTPNSLNKKLIQNIQNAGYDVILSIGELEENNIGSNCGQYISNLENRSTP